MDYIFLIILSIIFLVWAEKNIINWKTIVKYLWKEIYERSDLMATFITAGNDSNGNDVIGNQGKIIGDFKEQIDFRGKLINSILEYVNYVRKNEDNSAEYDTFGYGRYDFDAILNIAKTNPEHFKKFK